MMSKETSTMGPNRVKTALLKRIRKFGTHEGGAVLVVASVMLPVVVGGMGLGAETGYWYMTQRMLQHAADVSVHAGAVRRRAGDGKDKIDAAAHYVATAAGFASDADNTHVVNIPPVSGAYAGDNNAIEVLITDTRPRLLSSVFSDEPVVMTARAVAILVHGGSSGCVLALSPTAPAAVSVSGSTTLDLEGCEVASNSNATDSLYMGGSSGLTTPCVHTVGEAVTSTGLVLTRCTSVNEYASPVVDPYASVVEPAPTLAEVPCETNSSVGTPGGTETVVPPYTYNGVPAMRFCKGLDVKGSVDFQPGLYIIEGGTFSASGGTDGSSSTANLTGKDVTFYFTGGVGSTKPGSLNLTSQGKIDFAGPIIGPYSGIAFFGSRSEAGVSHSVSGGSGSKLQGALYMPASPLKFAGGSGGSGGCTQVIASTIDFTGGSTLARECDTAGTTEIVTVQTIGIVE